MHPSTTAIITATEYTDGSTNTHVQIFYGPLYPLECNAMNIIILHLWGFLCIRNTGCRG